ncbi:MAG: hypothetical protein GIW99_05370 [Candidatus Eremiobacteraeota bacterium]|nr:hypothetical protein [Candidatus Eremiobacteraeota bacterium]MBC5827097.1 hypothetical protein [Candidatus Eremiobacteraeota bacterium]
MQISATGQQSQEHRVVFGVYRDGDNNLDAVQERNVTDFVKTTAANSALKVVAEDTTALPRSPFFGGELRTESSIIEGGHRHIVRVQSPVDMSDRKTLAAFVAQTLETKAADGRFKDADVWVDLVDHGGGDGGGLQSQSSGGCMSLEDIAGAIADGRRQFHKSHPDADDSVTGVVANQCLMATLGFADALSHGGVKYLAASPETMIAPGVPSAKVADVLTKGDADWAKEVVDATMDACYGGQPYHPAAAFDVLDLSPEKTSAIRSSVGKFNAQVSGLPKSEQRAEWLHDVRSDFRAVPGMVRFDHSADMPWHADRPAEAAYDAVADDARLPQGIRDAARQASESISAAVLAHRESSDFGPFHASYADAVGPTAHLPVNRRSYDEWAEGGITETHNDFFHAVHGRDLARALGAYNKTEDAASVVA